MKYGLIIGAAIFFAMASTGLAQKKITLKLDGASTVASHPNAEDQRVLLPISLPSELRDVTIDHATLTIVVDTSSFDAESKLLGLGVFPLKAPWSQEQVTLGVLAGNTDQRRSCVLATSRVKAGRIEFQIADLIQAWVDGELENNGLLIRSSLEGTRNLVLRDAQNSIELTIYYTKHDLDR